MGVVERHDPRPGFLRSEPRLGTAVQPLRDIPEGTRQGLAGAAPSGW